jgi:hypothetical protein
MTRLRFPDRDLTDLLRLLSGDRLIPPAESTPVPSDSLPKDRRP